MLRNALASFDVVDLLSVCQKFLVCHHRARMRFAMTGTKNGSDQLRRELIVEPLGQWINLFIMSEDCSERALQARLLPSHTSQRSFGVSGKTGETLV